MKKIDNRDLINMKTTQDIIRRYDLSALDRLSKVKGNGDAIGIGMEPTVKAGVQSKDGFYDGDGNKVIEANPMPNGDISSLTYMNSLKTGKYYYDASLMTVSNMPTSCGIVDVVNVPSCNLGVAVTFYAQVDGSVYIKSCSSTNMGYWKEIITEDDVDIDNTNNTIVKRDSNGDIEVAFKIFFSNGDYIRYDDSDNHWWVSTDGGAERRLIDESHIRAYTMLITPVANTPTYAYLSYGHTFEENPMVVATAHTSVPGSTFKEVSSSSPTTTGTRIYVYRTSTTTTTIDVIVMERT